MISRLKAAACAAMLSASATNAEVVTHRIDFFPDLAGTYIHQLRFIGPQEGRIVSIRLIADFTTEHGFDASTINFLFVAPVPTSQGYWQVTGESLGWAGEGRFTATIESDVLDGEIAGGLWVWDLGSTNDPPSYSGLWSEDSRVEVDIEVPDAPPCPADFNQDGGVDGGDIESFFLAWEDSLPEADVNQDGGVDGGDVQTFFVAWEAGGC